MKAHSSRTLLGSLILGGALLAALPSIARAQMSLGSLSVHGAAAAGVYPQPVPNTNVAKYREYTDLAQQVIAPELRVLVADDKDDRIFTNFNSYNLGQTNQMYNLHAGVYGLLDIQAQYLDIPHYLSDDVGATLMDKTGATHPELAPRAPHSWS